MLGPMPGLNEKKPIPFTRSPKDRSIFKPWDYAIIRPDYLLRPEASVVSIRSSSRRRLTCVPGFFRRSNPSILCGRQPETQSGESADGRSLRHSRGRRRLHQATQACTTSLCLHRLSWTNSLGAFLLSFPDYRYPTDRANIAHVATSSLRRKFPRFALVTKNTLT